MGTKRCDVCFGHSRIRGADWKLVSYEGTFACSPSCILVWIEKNKSDAKITLKKAVDLCPEMRPDYKSDYERHFVRFLEKKRIHYEYERYGFFVGQKKTYTPDFFLKKYGVFLETKGDWGLGQKTKMKMFKREYPEVPILVVSWVVHTDFYRGNLTNVIR